MLASLASLLFALTVCLALQDLYPFCDNAVSGRTPAAYSRISVKTLQLPTLYLTHNHSRWAVKVQPTCEGYLSMWLQACDQYKPRVLVKSRYFGIVDINEKLGPQGEAMLVVRQFCAGKELNVTDPVHVSPLLHN